MKKQWILICVVSLTLLAFLVVALTIRLGVGTARAQEPKPGEDTPRVGDEAEAAVGDQIPIQGRLTDASGAPLTGAHSVTFRVYDDPNAGTLLCSTNYNPLALTNGLFNVTVTGCNNDGISGAQLYLGIQVDADAEMSPRQPIYAVPYARSLRPGADIAGEAVGSSILALYNSSTANGSKGLFSEAQGASGLTYGVIGRSNSPDGYGGYFLNYGAAGVGLFASAGNDSAADLVLGGNSATDDNGRIDSDPYYPGSDILLVSNDKLHIHLDNNNDEVNSDFAIYNSSNNIVLEAQENGRISAGINAGAATAIIIGDHYRDNAIVAWAKVSSSGTVSSEFGVVAVTKDAGSGSYLIEIDADAASAAVLIPIAIAELESAPDSAAEVRIVSINQETINTFRVYINNGSWALVDNDFVFMVTAR